MTREEAIKWFKESPFMHKDHVPFQMAIEALENENALLDRVLEIIDKVSHKASAKGEFWTAEKTIKILRRDVETLKVGEQK